MGVGGQHHVPAALPLGKTRRPLYRTLGAENLVPIGIRSPDLPALSEWLYRLSYPGPFTGQYRSHLTDRDQNILNTNYNVSKALIVYMPDLRALITGRAVFLD